MKKYLSVSTFVLSGALTILAGCNSTSSVPAGESSAQSGTAATGPVSAPAPTTGATPPPASVGETCTAGDANKLCLGIHFVTYTDPTGTPTATQAQAATIIHTMNTLWSQCDIGFQIEKYEAVDPTASGLTYGAASQNELDQIRTAYSAPSNELLAVTTGPWGTAVNAWTNMPGDAIYGAIMEASIVDYGGGIIYAHEFGHYLGLSHVADVSNLMDAIIYTTSTTLDASQCQTARDTANSYWTAMLLK